MHDKNWCVMETNRDSGAGRGGKSIDHQQCLIQYALLIEVRFVFVLWILKLEPTRATKSADEPFCNWQNGLSSCQFSNLRGMWLKHKAPNWSGLCLGLSWEHIFFPCWLLRVWINKVLIDSRCITSGRWQLTLPQSEEAERTTSMVMMVIDGKPLLYHYIIKLHKLG